MKKVYQRELVWLGDSLKNVRNFPAQVKKDIGDILNDVQHGDLPHHTKPLKGIGKGVFEIISLFDTNTYRTVYAVKIGLNVYVLHAFQKKSPKGIKTAQQDIDLIQTRYKKALEIEKEIHNA